MSVNVRGAANERKRRAIFDKHRFNADILILLETHSTPEVERIWESEWGGKAIYAHGTSNSKGTAVFLKKDLLGKVSNIYRDMEGRTILFDYTENEQNITITAIYAPNEDSPEYFKAIAELLKHRHEHKVIIGDFNLVLDVELDRENTFSNNNRAKTEVENICDEFCLLDTWRVQNGEKREFSWMKKGSFPIKASRIDFALISAGLDQKVKLIQYLSSIFTDHRAVYIVVDVDTFERGTGYWKLNSSFLQRKDYVDLMNREIQTTLSITTQKTPIERWENLKARISKVTKNFAKTNASDNKLIISQLSERVNEYESQLPLKEDKYKLLEQTRKELEEKTMERIKGVMFRSKVKWYEEGEKNTKYFFALEKAKYNAKTCFKLIDEYNQELTSQQEIIEAQRRFYTELYQKDDYVEFTAQNTSGVYVPEDIKVQQDQQLDSQDIQQAIKEMKKNKTPGEDGIPVDFYKVFWIQIKDVFLAMMHQCYEQNCLHKSARQGILNLIPKPNKDSRYMKNLRPITLLNTDYKIIEKAIANKMIPALNHIIHQDQRGFMKDRRISVNIRKMLDIIQEAKEKDLEAVILSLDFVKCFDKCSFSILHGSLEYFRFGKIIKEWTKILYNQFSVKIQNNGNFSQDIPIKKRSAPGGVLLEHIFFGDS